jgi:protoporphyrin/coproporphyrin ferrochelatase
MARVGVLLTAFGGPRDLDEVAPFMCSLLGTEPSEASLSEARRKYLTIGGASPLPGMAERIASNLERALSGLQRLEPDPEQGMSILGRPEPVPRAREGVRIPVAVGMRHAEPSIDQAVAQLASAGVRELVVVSLSPFEAAVTTGAYRAAVEAAVASHAGMRVIEAAGYHRSDAFIRALAQSTSEAIQDADIVANKTLIVFTAHSLPVADLEKDPTYRRQLEETAASVAAGIGLGAPSGFDALPGVDAFGGPGVTAPWLLAFQSKGRRGGEWAGPDLEDVIDAAAEAGFAAVIVSPIGFALDHMETLYDIDVCAADRTLGAGMEFYRAAVPNDGPDMIEALAEAVERVL